MEEHLVVRAQRQVQADLAVPQADARVGMFEDGSPGASRSTRTDFRGASPAMAATSERTDGHCAIAAPSW
ncbi:hypothetical protein [Paracidovorax citrulli]|uniref:hypothetical protein n=1 Tax=Paracidovorax citrulli TaxID=80869 RepID=UPI001E393004|nr:hypothetical protein [Paracidovorax citrulli]